MTTPRPSTLLDVFDSCADAADRGFRFLQGGAVLEGEPEPLVGYPQLVRRARAIAARLHELSLRGERAVLLYPPGQEYVLAFVGCVSAGVVAVPAYPPDPSRLERTLPRLLNIIEDADAQAILTIAAIRDMAGLLAEQAPGLAQKTWIATDEVDDAAADAWRAPDVHPDDLAFLQYTSGSTGTPKGVMLSHGNLLANLAAIRDRFATSRDSVGMIWLPPYHDMGLIGGILSGFYVGADVVLMSPLDFLKRPLSWLEAVSRYRATTSGGPNFAFELCCRKVTEEERARLDLSTWSVAFTGAEPIRKETLDRFVDRFGSVGFRRSAYLPCYGLAEATLLVTGARTAEEPAFRAVQVDALAHGRVAEPRIRYDTDVELVVDAQSHAVVAYDVSKSGLFVRTEAKLALGQLVQLRFELHGRRFELNAEVARFVDKGREGGKGPGYGCRFLRGDPATRARFERLVDELFVHRGIDDGGRIARVVVGTGGPADTVDVVIVQPDSGTRAWTDQIGEIWVSGPSVAQGYWRNDEVTQGTFRAYLSDTGEGPFLRTGDLGFVKDGELYIAGRIKDLVIIRGVNFYPQDLELSAEQAHPAVRPGCVAAFSVDLGGDERLVVVAEAERRKGGDRRGRDGDAQGHDRRATDRRQERALPELPTPDAGDGPAEIASQVRRRIAAEHDVSPYAVLLVKPGSIPKTSSGKIQRHACRARFLSGTLEVIGESAIASAGVAGLETAPTRDDVLAAPAAQRAALVLHFLRCAVVDVTGLQLDDASATRPLFELGVDSLAAAHLCHLVEERLHVPVALTSLLTGTTLQRLAERVAERIDGVAGVVADAPPAAATTPDTSIGQEGLLFLHGVSPQSAAYNEGAALRLLAGAQPDDLRGALEVLAQRHAVLRTTYDLGGERPRRVVAAAATVPFTVHDARELDDLALRALARREIERPFDLANEPPMRCAWIRTRSDPVVVVVFHHVAIDMWSVAVLAVELARLLKGEALATPGATYDHFVRWQRGYVDSPEAGLAESYWQRRLADAPPTLDLPTDHPRPAVEDHRGDAVELSLTGAQTRAVAKTAEAIGVTQASLLLAVFQALLARVAGAGSVVTGVPASGRGRREWRGTVGYFVNPLPIRTDFAPDDTLAAIARRAHEEVLAAVEHQDLPFARVVDLLGVRRDPGRHPVFQSMFVYERSPFREAEGLAAIALGHEGGKVEIDGVVVEPLAVKARAAQLDVALAAGVVDGALRLRFDFETALFDRRTVEKLGAAYVRLLEHCARAPDEPVASVELGGPSERDAELRAGRGPDVAGERRVDALVAARAEAAPDAVAIDDAGARTSYGLLERRVAELAERLRGVGVGLDARVAVLLDRSADLPAALLAVLRAGGAFVPLDPALPDDRLHAVLRDARPIAVVTTEARRARVAGRAGVVVVVDDAAATSRPRSAEEGAVDPPDALAYVTYTSGTTGTPKGVAVAHRSLANHAAAAIAAYGLTSADRVLQFASPSFDVCLEEIFPTLAAGATLVVRSPDAIDPRALLAFMTEQRVTVANLPSGFWAELVTSLSASGARAPSSLRAMIVGSERTSPEAWRAWRAHVGQTVQLFNAYGPTEATITSLVHAAPPNEVDGAAVPIGAPLPGVVAYVVDERLRLVPRGLPGELVLGGVALARGYLGDAARTAERFVPDPFSGRPGARLYRTGDLVRRRADGALEFLGRVDEQVKVRGFRVELGDVEAGIAAVPGVRAVACAAGAEDLAACVVLDDATTVEQVRRAARATLPAYMVPTRWARVDAIPTQASGKIDRAEVRARAATTTATPAARAPLDAVEEAVAAVCAEVLGVARVDLATSFFDAGGNSLAAIRVAARLRERLGREVPVRLLFEAQSPEALAARLRAATLVDDEGPRPTPRDGPAPLSFAQERLWFLDRLVGDGNAAYHIPAVFRARGALDTEAFAGALLDVVRRHDVLRTTYAQVEGRPVQCVADDPRVDFAVERARGLAGAALEERLARELLRPFDLAAGPVLRVRLFEVADDEHVVAFVVHHIAADGWSLARLTNDLSACYARRIGAAAAALPEPKVQYADFAAWQRRRMQGDVLARKVERVRARLAGAPPVLELPLDRPRPALQTFRGADVRLEVPPDVVARMRAVAQRGGATTFSAFLSGFAALLSRYAGQDDVVVGAPVLGRGHTVVEDVVGLFAETVALRARVDRRAGFERLLRGVHAEVVAALDDQDVPFERVVEALQPPRNLSASPIFQVMFVWNDVAALPGLPGVAVEQIDLPSRTSKFDLNLMLVEDGERVHGTLEYNTDLFDPETAAQMARHYVALLSAAAADPTRPIGRLPILATDERDRILRAWNDTVAPFDEHALLHDGFERRAAAAPDRVALIADGSTLTYGALDARANRIAHALVARGVRRGDAVVVCMDRGADLVATLLGVLKAGASYAPAEPTFPAARVAAIARDVGARLLLVDAHGAAVANDAGAGDVVVLDDAELAPLPSTAPPRASASHDVAYTIFTSGSTGTPKGVVVRHRAAANLIEWVNRTFGVDEDDRLLFVTSVCFDLSVYDVFGVLAAGGAIRVASRAELADADRLLDVLVDERITFWDSAPAALRRLSPLFARVAERARGASLRRVFLSGDWIPLALPDQVRAVFRGAEIVSLGGATEATVWSNSFRVGAVQPTWTSIPYGRPMQNARYHVLDEDMEPCPIGVAGDLYIGGECLAVGYANKPAVTAEKFVPDPFSTSADRLYKTGDRARYWRDGTLEFLGRRDQQVKVRGFRIELAEVEAAVAAHPDVKDACVHAWGDRDDRSLAAYFVARPGAVVDAAAVRAKAATVLPEYMIPSRFVALPALPVTANGKLDRAALPKPGAVSATTRVPPRDALEARLAAIFARAVGVDAVGVHDDFFELGGQSLLAVQVVAEARAQLDRPVALSSLFRFPTVAALADHLRSERVDGGELLVPLGPPTSSPPIFCIHPSGGDVAAYAALARELGPSHQVVAVQSRVWARGEVEHATLDEMADSYVEAIRRHRGTGPYRLLGWSMGGVLAHAIAARMEAAGDDVELVALWDAHLTDQNEARTRADPLAALAVAFGSVLPLAIERHADELRAFLPVLAAAPMDERVAHAARWLQERDLLPADLHLDDVRKRVELSLMHDGLLDRHRPRAVRAPLHVWWASASMQGGAPPSDWSRLGGATTVHVVDGDHFSLVRGPTLAALARALDELLASRGPKAERVRARA